MRRIVLLSMVVALVLAMSVCAFAAKVPTPTELAGGKIVTAAEMKSMVDAGKVHVFDMRKALNYGKGHIPGAASVPYKGRSKNSVNFDSSLDKFSRKKIPTDKNANIAFHSDGPKGWKSYKASVTLIKEGYKNILWFRPGYSTWVKEGNPIEK